MDGGTTDADVHGFRPIVHFYISVFDHGDLTISTVLTASTTFFVSFFVIDDHNGYIWIVVHTHI